MGLVHDTTRIESLNYPRQHPKSTDPDVHCGFEFCNKLHVKGNIVAQYFDNSPHLVREYNYTDLFHVEKSELAQVTAEVGK